MFFNEYEKKQDLWDNNENTVKVGENQQYAAENIGQVKPLPVFIQNLNKKPIG